MLAVIIWLAVRGPRKIIVPQKSVTESPEYQEKVKQQEAAQRGMDSLQHLRKLDKITTDSLYNELNRITGKRYKNRLYYEALRDSISQFDSTDVDNYWTNRHTIKRPH